MKKIFLFIMVLMLAVNVSAVGGPEIKASILRYEPAPAEQGRTFDVWVQLSNAGTKADNVAIRFEPEYPFSLPAGQRDQVDIGTIAATETKVEKFTVFVDPNAPNGDSSIKFLYRFVTNNWVRLEAPISLQSQDAVLIVDDYKVLPSPIVPGQLFDVVLNVRNAGRIAVKNLNIGIDLEDGKFSTIGTGAKQRVSYIGIGETETVKFQLASDTTTEVKVYSVPVSLDYQDDRNKVYSEEAKISLLVNAEPELSLTVDATDFESRKVPGTVSLKIVNKGIADLKYVTVVLAKTPDYDILSPSNEAYVGNLDSDDFETVDFVIKPLVESPRLQILLEFKDPYNVDFAQDYVLPLRIITDEDLGKKKSPVGWIVALLIVVGGVYYWRKRRKKRK